MLQAIMPKEIWKPLSPSEVRLLFSNVKSPYWVAGGIAIDLFIGNETRPHEDLDICIRREDQLQFQRALNDWKLESCDPPGSGAFRTWSPGQLLPDKVHNIWCRKTANEEWSLELLLCDFENGEWIYRRNKSIRGPKESFGWEPKDGLRVLSPEIQLLYKSRGQRDKDFLDLKNCLPKMEKKQKEKLKDWIAIDSGETHPWVGMI